MPTEASMTPPGDLVRERAEAAEPIVRVGRGDEAGFRVARIVGGYRRDSCVSR